MVAELVVRMAGGVNQPGMAPNGQNKAGVNPLMDFAKGEI
jgi:hypothetical protein